MADLEIGLTEQEAFEAQLKALGIAKESTEVRVFDELVTMAVDEKTLPSPTEIARRLSLPPTTVQTALARLYNQGKVVRGCLPGVRRAVYLPRV